MAEYTTGYMNGRKKYTRPQAMIWSDNDGEIISSKLFPSNAEIGSNIPGAAEEFIILSDHNRSAIDLTIERIEQRNRMINGRMRSYHIADKLNLSMQWNMLPSRSFAANANFDTETGKSPYFGSTGKANSIDLEFTTDGGAGGVELLDWYNNNTGSFWVYLAYDNYKNFENTDNPYGHLAKYNEIVEVFFSAFDYSVQKRGGTNYDFWNISLSLEEV